MVLIVSTDQDHSTNDVIKWLLRLKVPFVRIGDDKSIQNIEILSQNNNSQIVLTINDKEINLNNVTSFWHRKGDISLFSEFKVELGSLSKAYESSDLRNYLNREIDSLKQYVMHVLRQKNHLGNAQVGDANKLTSFHVAASVGFLIPNTYVCNNTSKIKQKFNEGAKQIGKPINDSFVSRNTQTAIQSKYTIIESKFFTNKSRDIFPSCVQQYIDKKFELRVFYLRGRIYSMAIFSQKDKQTKIDYRNYNDQRPNRMVPYNLPVEVEKKVEIFMKKMDLQTGSLDLILTKENEYYFLEVNPFGQYGMVSVGSNINLDKEIVNELVNQDFK